MQAVVELMDAVGNQTVVRLQHLRAGVSLKSFSHKDDDGVAYLGLRTLRTERHMQRS
jgi:hypothetical protein